MVCIVIMFSPTVCAYYGINVQPLQLGGVILLQLFIVCQCVIISVTV